MCECDWNHHLKPFMHKMWCACVTAWIMKKKASWVEKKKFRQTFARECLTGSHCIAFSLLRLHLFAQWIMVLRLPMYNFVFVLRTFVCITYSRCNFMTQAAETM